MAKKIVARDWRLRIEPDDRFEITEKGKKYLSKENAKSNKKVIKK